MTIVGTNLFVPQNSTDKSVPTNIWTLINWKWCKEKLFTYTQTHWLRTQADWLL